MLTHTIPISVDKQQVLDFANITGDNISIHILDGVVQGGLIIGLLPYWFRKTKDDGNFPQEIKTSMTVKMDCKFKNPLFANTQVNITFSYKPLKLKMSQINWTIHDTKEYCSGIWIVSSLS